MFRVVRSPSEQRETQKKEKFHAAAGQLAERLHKTITKTQMINRSSYKIVLPKAKTLRGLIISKRKQ